jgi:hypothetical protein
MLNIITRTKQNDKNTLIHSKKGIVTRNLKIIFTADTKKPNLAVFLVNLNLYNAMLGKNVVKALDVKNVAAQNMCD